MLRTLCFCSLLATAASAQTTWYVDLTGNPPGSGTQADPYTSIDHALQQALTVSGDTVLVAPGTYTERVRFPGRGVSLISTNGAAVTIIDAAQLTGSVVKFNSTDGTTMLLQGFTLTGGTGTKTSSVNSDRQGGGIFASGAIVRVRACIIRDNTAFEGGGVYAENTDFGMRNSTVRNNSALGLDATGGGLTLVNGTAFLRRCIIQFNNAGHGSKPGRGGGIYAAGPLSVLRCSIADNVGGLTGGGIYGADTIDMCRILRNTAQNGGGLYTNAQVRQTTIQGNLADSAAGTINLGGGVWGVATLTDCLLEGNEARGRGGAANNATLVRCTIVNNIARWAPSSLARGGGVNNCTLSECTLLDNEVFDFAGSRGGGASGSELFDCLLAGNEARAAAGTTNASGGGAYQCTLQGCELLGNSAQGYGGGAYLSYVFDTAIIGNDAIWGGGSASGTLIGSTVFDNTATLGAGGFHVETLTGTSAMLDSIVWQNGASEIEVENAGVLISSYSDVLGGWPGTGNIDADPLFWNESTGDVHLQAGSPCIDAGDPSSTLDPDGSRADMGAYPFDPSYSG